MVANNRRVSSSLIIFLGVLEDIEGGSQLLPSLVALLGFLDVVEVSLPGSGDLEQLLDICFMLRGERLVILIIG